MTSVTGAPVLSALDVASGTAFDPHPPRDRLPRTDLSPARALEDAVLPAVRRPPCLVSFSGGRDSSLVLAAATRVARREGLALPVPATNRFAGAPRTDEGRWQEQVVAHLGLPDWQRLDFTGELDAIGPYAQRVLREHGLLWPFNVHFHLPLLDAARGGSVLTGAGGDELFFTAQRVPRPGRRPRDLARAALRRAPRRVRAEVTARRHPIALPWLRPHAQRELARAMALEAAAEPRDGVAARMGFWLGVRYLRVARQSLATCAEAGDVLLTHPLCAPPLWSAIARAGAPHGGFEGHAQALCALFDGWLPEALAGRRDKAQFDAVFWHDRSRAFARRWDGSGIPDGLVDRDALREHWRSDAPAVQSLTLLQAAWLASERS